MNDKLIFEIIKYILIFIVSLFLPKKIIYFARSFFIFCIRNIGQFWYLFLFETVLSAIAYYCRDQYLVDPFLTLKNLFLIIISTFLIIITIKLFRLKFKKPNSFLTIYPTFTIKENEFIASDIQSEKINEIIKKKIEFFENKFFVYRNNLINSKLENIPSFLPVIIGFVEYKRQINKKLNTKNPISIYFQKDLLDSELSTELFYDKTQFINAKSFDEIIYFSDIIGKSKNTTIENKINDILHLYFFITSQSHLDMTIDLHRYEHTVNILSDLEEQLTVISSALVKYDLGNKEVDLFFYSWKGIISRYYSIIYLEKKDYKKAIDYIIESNNFNPYYPQSSYQDAKNQYITKYLIELLPKVNDNAKQLEIEDHDSRRIENLLVNQLNKLDFEDSRYNYHILIEIIKRNHDNEELIDYIEKELLESEINNNNIFSLIFIAEAYKYLPIDGGKINSIYINRIPKAVELLEKSVAIDEEFELLYLRISSLKFMFASDKSESEMAEVMSYLSKHIHLYTKYGISI